MTGKRIGYIRVSTVEQNPDRQLEGMTLDKRFVDHASGSLMSRPQLDLMMEYVREEDKVFVHSMDRLARSVKHLRSLIDEIVNKGASIHFVKENLTFCCEKSPVADLMLMLMGAVAEFELARIRERQLEGIKLAKKKGLYRGKPRMFNEAQKQHMYNDFHNFKRPVKEIAKMFGVSQVTIYTYLKEMRPLQQKEKTG